MKFLEKLSIVTIEGLGQNLLEQKGHVNGFLGTSLNKGHFFTKQHIGMYFDWALEHCADFLFLVDDWEERHNYRVFKGLEENAATALAVNIGKERVKSAESVLRTYNPVDQARIRIVVASELFKDPKCTAITSHLYDTFQENPDFRDDVHNQVTTNIGSKVEDWRKTVLDEDYQKGLPLLARFILEEVGVTVFIREMGYPVEIYPAHSMQIMRNLYQGTYPELSTSLGLGSNYGYIDLEIVPA